MKTAACILALCLTACVSTVSPDGTRTTSFAPSVDQLNAATALASSLRNGGK